MSRFELSPVVREFQNQKQAHLTDPHIRIVAGVSGGPDSMAMLYLLHRLEVETAVVVHCNYQLRGNASDEDQKLVENMCMNWKFECVSVRLDPDEEAEGNFQNWARERRYQIFRDIKKENGAHFILTAHHQDDQVETIFQKILRGAGITSWKGMDILDGDLFRPFLNISKKEIMEFVQDFNVPYRIDGSNEESTYARNFIRKHWLPDLNRLFPGWEKNLLRLSKRAKEFQVMSGLISDQVSSGEDKLNRAKFFKLDPIIRPVILRDFILKSGIEADLSQGFLAELEKLTELQSGKKLQISDEYYILRDRSFFKIVREPKRERINQKIDKDQLEQPLNIGNRIFSTGPAPDTFSENSLHLDFHQLKFPLTLRTWEAGDTFQPLGMKGTQLVSDHLTNRKIPSQLKKEALVLESFDSTICAVIFPVHPILERMGTVSETVRCKPATTKTLIIRVTE